MHCCTCGCELGQDDTDEVTEVYGIDYAGWCLDCSVDHWHDDHLAPDDGEDDACEME